MKPFLQISVLFASLLLVGQPLRAQTPAPSLQLGLSGLTFQPGTLDAELIMQIIAEKQAEIKKRAVKNLLLRQVNNAGGTIYIFTDNVLNAIVNETDNAIRTRTILENTVNLAFSMALTEYVRQSPDPQLQVSLSNLSAQIRPPALPLFTRLLKGKPGPAPTYYNQLRSFQNTRDTSQVVDRSFLYTLDIVSEALRTNKRLEALGLMRITYPGQWEALNLYMSDSTSSRRRHHGDSVKIRVDTLLRQLLDNVGFITDQIEVGSFSYPSRTVFTLADRKGTFDAPTFRHHIGQTISILDTMLTDTSPRYQRFRATHGPALAQYWTYLQRINEVNADSISLQQMSDVLYHLTVDVRPQFEQVAEFVPQVSRLHAETLVLRNLLKQGVVFSQTKTDQASLMRLIARLYQFRKAKTYSDYLNIMTDLPQLVGDSQIKSTLNVLLSFIKNYVTIRQQSGEPEVVSIDVESLLVMLQTYSQQRTATVQFMFTVGANTAYRSANVGDTVRNFTYVGEKIGLKIKLRDWQYLRSFNKYQTFYRHAGSPQAKIRLQPPQEPIVSNLHLIIFGSGLLYNLVKSSNNTSFRQPLLGIGAGLTFINSLDVNLSASFPQKSSNAFHENFAHPFVALGFDVLFMEYISRLTKKRTMVASK